MNPVFQLLIAGSVAGPAWLVYKLYIEPRFNPLLKLAGPQSPGVFSTDVLLKVLSPSHSPKLHVEWAQRYGRSIRIRGLGPPDERLLTLDPVSVAYILRNSTVYEKPWQSRALITSLIGCGMLSAEGDVHKRQRRVATPAFSIQNLRNLVPIVFGKGTALKDKWSEIVRGDEGAILDVSHWVNRATFDVIGAAGFDYQFNAIQDETNELFNAYNDMFETAINQGSAASAIISIYAPWFYKLFPNNTTRTVDRCHEVIHRVAGQLIQEKKRKIEEGEKSGMPYVGKDLLSLMLKANISKDIPLNQRLSDEDVLNSINTFMFAGSDTSSVTLAWTLWLLAHHPDIQTRLREEIFAAFPDQLSSDVSHLDEDEIGSMYEKIANLSLLNNVARESIRVIPAIHSSIRVATKDDDIPTMFPVKLADGSTAPHNSVRVAKGTFIHVAVEGFNLDKEFWGPDAWEFNPDRWDDLPETAKALPGLFNNTLTFSAGPRSCIGMRFSMIEIKTFLTILVSQFVFEPTEDRIVRENVVLTRPYVAGKFSQGSQCPLRVKPYHHKSS